MEKYSKDDIDTLAQYLNLYANGYNDLVWLITLTLHSNTWKTIRDNINLPWDWEGLSENTFNIEKKNKGIAQRFYRSTKKDIAARKARAKKTSDLIYYAPGGKGMKQAYKEFIKLQDR